MRLGIDASNIRGGGGVTHLIEVLRAADPPAHGFSEVVVWSGRSTLDRLEDRPWLSKQHVPALEKSLAHRIFWSRAKLSGLAKATGCDLLFVPGGAYAGDFRPIVTMSRNLLPFEWREAARYGPSWHALRCLLLRWTQSAAFRRADGVIFLNHYAQGAVTKVTGSLKGRTTIVPHGVEDRFVGSPRPQKSLSDYSDANPFRLLYVSIIDIYKHQWTVAEAVYRLRSRGLPVVLDLVGPGHGPGLERFRQVLARRDPDQQFIRYHGEMPYEDVHRFYSAADLCVFASSCENMPNILLEGMASGVPLACSDRGPMPELLGDGGLYFDPEDVESIAKALQDLMASPQLRMEKAVRASELAGTYSWQRCADSTFGFLADIAAAYDAR